MTVTLQSDLRKSKLSRIAGEVVSADENGVVEVSEEMAQRLLSDQYSFLGFQKVGAKGDRIQKIEESEPIIVEKEEEIKTPNSPNKTPAEIIEEESKDTKSELTSLIESIEEFDKLKEIAKELELPETDWTNYKSKKTLKKYLLSKI